MMEIFLDEVNQPIEVEFDIYFTYIEKIGSGSFGTVITSIYKELNKEVAVKIIEKSRYNTKNFNRLRYEINILQQIKHRNIMEFIRCIETNSKIFIIAEYIKGGTLRNFIDKCRTEGKFI
jgi:serine/threonine protein kinase